MKAFPSGWSSASCPKSPFQIAGILALAAVYFGAAKLGLSLAFQAEQVSAVWPPTGIGLAALLLFGPELWPGIALGAFFANYTAHEPLATAGGIAIGNALEALSGYWLLSRVVNFDNALERLRDILGFVGLAAVFSTMVSATIGVNSLCLGGVQPWPSFGSLWLIWWLGDAAGALIVAPVLLVWLTKPAVSWQALRTTEGLALMAGAAFLSLIVFAGLLETGLAANGLVYAIFPFIIWGALRFGQPATSLVTLLASGISIWGTVHGYGPFAVGSPNHGLMLLQCFMAAVAFTGLLLGAAISERNSAERRRREKLLELETLYETAPVGLSLLDSDLRYVRINRALAAINGVPVSETLGRRLREVVPQIADLVEPVYRQVIQTGQAVSSFEFRAATPKEPGALRDWIASYYPLKGQDGSVVAVNCIVQDVSEHKRKERDQRFLAEASRMLASSLDYETTLKAVAQLVVPQLADWCAVDILLADQTIHRVAVVHSDPAKMALGQELLRRYPLRLDMQEGTVMRTGQSLLRPEITDEMLSAYARDHEHLEVLRQLNLRSTLVVPLSARGQMLGAISLVMAESGRHYDAHDLALAEDLAHRASFAVDNARLYGELKDAARRKDEFLAMLAHELRNPLAPVRNALHVLHLRPGEQKTFEQVGAMMERQVEHMTRLIDDLLDMSRITRGKFLLHKEILDLALLVRTSAADHRSAFEAAGLTIELDVPQTPVWVTADPTRLAQVLDNLLENGQKFTDTGGKISIRLSTNPTARQAILVVRDTGVGIEPELLPHLFDTFSQAGQTLDRSRGGLGLGLAIAKGLMELHGGGIKAASAGPGRGAEFTIWLPQAKKAPELSDDSASFQPSSRPLRILVVEDNPDSAETLRMLLELYSHEVAVANNGPSAIEVAKRIHPDVVLCDIGLPGMNGFEVAKLLRQGPETAQARLLAVTGYGREEDRRRSVEAGFDDHLVKPVDPEQLLQKLEASVPLDRGCCFENVASRWSRWPSSGC